MSSKTNKKKPAKTSDKTTSKQPEQPNQTNQQKPTAKLLSKTGKTQPKQPQTIEPTSQVKPRNTNNIALKNSRKSDVTRVKSRVKKGEPDPVLCGFLDALNGWPKASIYTNNLTLILLGEVNLNLI